MNDTDRNFVSQNISNNKWLIIMLYHNRENDTLKIRVKNIYFDLVIIVGM